MINSSPMFHTKTPKSSTFSGPLFMMRMWIVGSSSTLSNGSSMVKSQVGELLLVATREEKRCSRRRPLLQITWG